MDQSGASAVLPVVCLRGFGVRRRRGRRRRSLLFAGRSLLSILPERGRASDDVEEPPHVSHRLLLGVVLCVFTDRLPCESIGIAVQRLETTDLAGKKQRFFEGLGLRVIQSFCLRKNSSLAVDRITIKPLPLPMKDLPVIWFEKSNFVMRADWVRSPPR